MSKSPGTGMLDFKSGFKKVDDFVVILMDGDLVQIWLLSY